MPKSRPIPQSEDLPPGTPVSFVALANHDRYTVCRLLAGGGNFEFRGRDHWQLMPAEIVHATLLKPWIPNAGRTMWARITKREFDIAALNLKPLALQEQGLSNLDAANPRPAFEMELILLGYDHKLPNGDPIGIAFDLHYSGDQPAARYKLMDLLAADLRCLDAFAHLGNFDFDQWSTGIEYYEPGYKIGELSLGPNFQGVLPWDRIGNRPFLRCMNGYGLALWRRKRFDEALAIFRRLLWLNPTDNQGVRILIEDVKAKRLWEDCAVDGG